MAEATSMRLIGRHDTSLAIGLILGALILFHQPFQFLFDVAGDIERQYHLDLVQPLVVLAVVFAFHQYRKRQEAKGEAFAAVAEAKQAQLRSQELERLVGLSRGLASVMDFTGLSQVLIRYLPKFSRDHAAWVLLYQQGCWDVLLRDTDDRRSTEELETIAERALMAEKSRTTDDQGVQIDDVLGFPLMGGVHPLGLMFIRNVPPLSLDERRGLEAAAALAAIAIRNVQTLVETRDQSVRDGLTGCFNRAHAVERLTSELRRARRHGRPLSVVMFDVDSFKRVNDSYGHLTGDHVLAEIGRRLGEVVRTTDVKCRYGGDEFLIILPDTPAIGARQVAESVRQALSTVVDLGAEGGSFSVTVSVGVVSALPEENDAMSMIARADRALYRAKHRGKNSVCGEEPETAKLRLASAPA
jgi:diguanylate cyclase (GGDEF)-like protein